MEWLPAKIWFGNTYFGLIDIAQVATKTVDENQLRTWLSQYFHRNNAALVLSGPPPEGLRLPLPEGDRPQPLAAQPFEITTPSWSSIPNGLAGNALVKWNAEMATALVILEARLTETLRHRDGLVYEIAGNHQIIDGQRALISFGGDIPDHETAKAAQIAHEILADLANAGPSEEELSIDRDRFIEQLDEPEFVEYHAFDAAITELTGWSSVVKHHRKIIDGLRREDVANAARELIGQLVLYTPEESRFPDLPELSATAEVLPLKGKQVKRAFLSSVPKQYRLFIGDEGLTSYHGESVVPVATIRYDDIAGVGLEEVELYDAPILHLFAQHGGSITVHPGEWRGGTKLVREIRKNLDPSLCFPAPDAMRMLEED
jgi:hypothetical protein